MSNTQQPAYQAYTVVKREGQDDYWLPIGTAFAHADGKGLNVLPQALPINGKLVLRSPKENGEQAAARETTNERPSRQRQR